MANSEKTPYQFVILSKEEYEKVLLQIRNFQAVATVTDNMEADSISDFVGFLHRSIVVAPK